MRLPPDAIAHVVPMSETVIAIITKEGRLLTVSPANGMLLSSTWLPEQTEIERMAKEPKAKGPARPRPPITSSSEFTL